LILTGGQKSFFYDPKLIKLLTFYTSSGQSIIVIVILYSKILQGKKTPSTSLIS
jgi:hypothetical protein